MRAGFRVFDADAHVVYPADLWSRFLEPRFRHRVDRKQPAEGFETYNPVRVDGRYTQHPTVLYGQFQKLINWTQEDMIAKYGDCMTLPFRGDLVAEAIARDGIDIAVIYGPEFDMWYTGIDPEMQAAMARAYNRWGAEMAETSGGRVLAAVPIPLNDVTRAVEEIQYAYEHLGARAFWTRPDEFNGRNLGDRYDDPIWELIQDLGVSFATHEPPPLRNGDFLGHRRSLAHFGDYTKSSVFCLNIEEHGGALPWLPMVLCHKRATTSVSQPATILGITTRFPGVVLAVSLSLALPMERYLPAVAKLSFRPLDRAGRTRLLALCWIGFT